MAKQFKVGLIVQGDGKGGVKAVQATTAEMRKLAKQTRDNNTAAAALRKAYSRAGESAGRALKTAGVAGAAASAALAVLVKRSFETADSLGKIADTINTGTEALASLRHAADLTGLSAGEMDKSIERMVRQIGQARRGSKEAADAFEALGVNLDEFSRLRADEQFAVISERIQTIENRADQAAVATALFGRNGVRLLNTLDLGADKLRNISVELEALNVALSREEVAAIEAANDSITRLQTVAQGLGNTIAVQISPFITEFANGLYDASVESDGFQAQVTLAMEKVAGGIGFVGDSVRGVQIVFKSLEVAGVAATSVVLDAFLNLNNGIERILNGIIAGINLSIDALNVINPFGQIDNIGSIDFSNSPLYAGLEKWSADAPAKIKGTLDEIHALMMKPLPSAAIEEAFDRIRAKALESGKAAAGQFGANGEINRAIKQGINTAEYENYFQRIPAEFKPAVDKLITDSDRFGDAFETIWGDVRQSILGDFDSLGYALLGSLERTIQGLVVEAAKNPIKIGMSAVLDTVLGGSGGGLGLFEKGAEFLGNKLMDMGMAMGSEVVDNVGAGILNSAQPIGQAIGSVSAPIIAGAIAGNLAAFHAGAALGQAAGIDGTTAGAAAVLNPQLALVNLAVASLKDPDTALNNLLGGKKYRPYADRLSFTGGVDGISAVRTTDIEYRKNSLDDFDHHSTRVTELADLSQELNDTFGPALDSARAAAELFGGSVEGFSVSLSESIHGLTDDELGAAIQRMIAGGMDSLAQTVAPWIASFQRGGEALIDTLVRVTDSTATVDDQFERIGASLDVPLLEGANARLWDLGAGIAGLGDSAAVNAQRLAAASTALIDAVGGVDQFSRAINSLIGFAHQDTQNAILTNDARSALGDELFAELPATREALFDLFNTFGSDNQALILSNIDLLDDYYAMLESGREATAASEREQADFARGLRDQIGMLSAADPELYALNLRFGALREQAHALGGESLAGLVDQLYALESAALEAENLAPSLDLVAREMELAGDAAGALALRRDAELAAMSSADAALQRRIWMLEGEAAAAEAANAFDVALGLADGMDPLRSALAALGLSFEGLQQAAQIGLVGVQGFLQGLDQAGRAALNDYTSEILSLIPGAAETTSRSVAGSLSRSVSQSLPAQDDWAAIASSMRDWLSARRRSNAVDPDQNLHQSLQDFFRTANAARGKDQDAMRAITGIGDDVLSAALAGASSEMEYKRIRATVFGTVSSLADRVDPITIQQDQLDVLGDIRDLLRHGQTVEINAPGFARGGDHAGGIRWVGEDGPELEFTGAARILSHRDSMAFVGANASGGSAVERIARLENAIDSLNRELQTLLYQIAKNTSGSERYLQKWDKGGMPSNPAEVAA